LGRQQRTHYLRPNWRVLLLRTLSRLRTTQQRKTPSHRHSATWSKTRLHHAYRSVASARKCTKCHASKTLPVQKPRRIPPVHQQQIWNSYASMDFAKWTIKEGVVPKEDNWLLQRL